MRIFCAGIDHETNTLSPIPTSLDSFGENFLYRPSTGEGREQLEGVLATTNLISLCKGRGHDVEIGVIAAAHPSALLARADYELLRDELIGELHQAMPVDAVLLRLHGAMAADGYDDCEGDILERVRAATGSSVPVGVLFDLHGNVTDAMVEHATILMACKEYPHTDFNERSEELIDLIESVVRGECKPATAFVRAPLVGLFQTTRQPMRGFVDKIISLESHEDILTISAMHGFLWGNSSHVGAGILVATNNKPDAGRRLAEALAHELFSLREEIDAKLVSVEAGLNAALTAVQGPVTLADVTDNPGGGAASDSTFMLQALLDRDAPSAALGMLYDPIAVELCMKAGIGATLPLRVGGKIGAASGAPVDIDATVTGLVDNHWQWAMGVRDNLGPAAAVRVKNVEIVLTSMRQQVLSPECFTNIGIRLIDKKIIIVKSSQHFQAAFEGLSKQTLFVEAPGALSKMAAKDRLARLTRPIWPLDATPFEAHGDVWQ